MENKIKELEMEIEDCKKVIWNTKQEIKEYQSKIRELKKKKLKEKK